MREYIIHYDSDDHYYGEDGLPHLCKNMSVVVSAKNAKEARQKFDEMYYALWHTPWKYRARHIKIERKESK